jgi:hypothetical protein
VQRSMIGCRLLRENDDNFLDDISDASLIYPLISGDTPFCTDHALVSQAELVVAPFGLSFTHLYPTAILSQLFSMTSVFPPIRVQNV